MRVLGCAVCLVSVACAQNVNVKVDAPHTQVLLDGTDIGPVGDAGADIELRPGMTPVKYEIRDHDKSTVGSIARTEPVWWLVAGGVVGALCCAPTLAAGGFCVANPAVIGAPLAYAVSGDVGALTSTFVAPSWLTLPAVTTCGALGLSPLALAFIAETVPERIVIKPAAPAPAPRTAMVF